MNLNPNNPSLRIAAAAALMGAAALAGCTVHRTREVVVERPGPPVVYRTEVIYTDPPPSPAPIVEVVTVSPGPEFIWIAGSYEWVGGSWTWERGHWARPIHAHAVWEPGGWHHEGNRHEWKRGHWK